MDVELTSEDRALLRGESGEGAALAMRILVRMADVLDAPGFLDIEMAHIDSALFQGDATLEYAERLAGAGARVQVPSTLNVSGVDLHGWKDWEVPPEWAEKAHRQMQAYQAMGCKPTFTCAPYQTEARPAFGQQIAWGESSAIVFANSVLGARTERYPDLLDICCAITGRAPAFGLHLDENRGGQVLIRLDRIPEDLQRTPEFCAILGHRVGRLAGSRVPVVSGAAFVPTEDQFKALGAAMASSGAVALFHWVGVTPEAPDLETALHGREPEETHDLTVADLTEARNELTTAGSPDQGLHLVVLGSPHFSLQEFQRLAPLVEGRRRHSGVRFNVTCGRGVQAIARAQGVLDPIEAFGAEVTVDTCILTTPMLGDEVRTLMTNSPKFAYYTPGLLNKTVVFGSLEDCVESAVQGTVVRSESPWDAHAQESRSAPGSG
jgi:predicted aconitase